MAIASVTELTSAPQSISQGPVKFQLVTVSADSGATSGTVTATRLKEIYHILLPGIKSHTAAPTYSGNVASLTFTVKAETTASQTIDGIVYTATANQGLAGNAITIQEVDGSSDPIPVTNGNEVVTVSGTAIVIRIDPTAVTGSIRTNVRIAVNASAAAAALVTATGTDATVASVTAATHLIGGVSGGYRGNAICIGR